MEDLCAPAAHGDSGAARKGGQENCLRALFPLDSGNYGENIPQRRRLKPESSFFLLLNPSLWVCFKGRLNYLGRVLTRVQDWFQVFFIHGFILELNKAAEGSWRVKVPRGPERVFRAINEAPVQIPGIWRQIHP